jgi:thioredoxin-like negative regulator of GroEL
VPEQFNILCPDCLAPTIIEPGKQAQGKIVCSACGAQLLSAEAVACTTDRLQRFVTDAALPLLVYFHAPGCTPCTLMTPIIDRLAKKLRGVVCCAKINARQECELAAAYGVSSVPAIALFKSGSEAKRFSGAMDIKSLTAWILE